MKSAPWILCCLLFAVILLQQMCKGKTEVVPKSEYDAMVKTKDDTLKQYRGLLKADTKVIDEATSIAVQANEKAKESEAKVTESQREIKRLNAKIDAARKEKPDSSFVTVSPRYILGCDSLQWQTQYQDGQLNQLKNDNAVNIAAKQKEIAARDKKINTLQDFNSAMITLLDSCQAKVKEKEKTVKVKNQWYGVVGLTGNKINPVAGGEVGIILINKKGVLYGVKGELLAGQLWGGVKTGFRLFR